uniref:DNA-processing protein DprA n=1 Tax=Alistipes sp. TaxID=1872444 RepID=UPI0040561A66
MTIHDLALALTPHVGVKGAKHLLECFGSAERIFSLSEEELRLGGTLREDALRGILSRGGLRAAEREAEYLRRHNLWALASTDEQYPKLLSEINDNPHILYGMGHLEALQGPMLSMVGTREQSPYGERACRYLIKELSERIPNLVIVSGLAFGIDSVCHRMALEYGLRTVAVVANPLPEVTPTQHTALAREIIERGGAILSEQPSSAKQRGTFYVARNRIIAALSEGTVVVESPATGGALLTAQYADGYQRTVMAVPGRIGDRTAFGTNALIRNRKAQMILSGEDIIRELMWDLHLEKEYSPPQKEEQPLTADEEGLLCCFRSDDPLSFGELVELSQLESGTLSALLVGLELSGAIRQLPGNRYEKLRR